MTNIDPNKNCHNIHNVKVVTGNGITKIYLDDQELKGCYHAEFKWDVKEFPVLDLQVIPRNIHIEIEKAEVNEVYEDRSE